MDQPREDDRIQCLECGKWFRALPAHLARSHGYSDEDYRLKFGVPVGTPLVCLEWSENQSRKSIERDAKRTLTARGPAPGFKQRESVQSIRREQYSQLAADGTEAASRIDKTEARRAALAPYPVTVDQAADRIGCTRRAAYNFLSFCVQTGRLRRIKRGTYGEI